MGPVRGAELRGISSENRFIRTRRARSYVEGPAPVALVLFVERTEVGASCEFLTGNAVFEDRSGIRSGGPSLRQIQLLHTGAQHGYGIAVRLQQLSSDVLQVEEGSLYPALYRMEQRGWISSSWGTSENNRRARFYQLTRVGRRQLDAETESWRRLTGAVARVLEA